MTASGKRLSARELLAATDLLDHVEALAREMDGVRRADDIEYVHRMRVASRRLRNALAIFRDVVSAGRTKKWRREIKRITRSLGSARDTDVQIEFLDGVEAVLPPVDEGRLRLGLDRLRLRLVQHRASVQGDVVAAVDRLEASGVVGEMRKTFAGTVEAGRREHVRLRAPGLQRQARAEIDEALGAMLAYEPYIRDPERIDELHEMRIEAKHLRYTLEAYGPAFKGRLKPHIRLAKKVQSALGDIHDLDVWLAYLPAFAGEEERRFRAFYGHARDFRTLVPGLDFLAAHCRRERDRQYDEFVSFWEEHARRGVWERFAEIDRDLLPAVVVDVPLGRVGPAVAGPSEGQAG